MVRINPLHDQDTDQSLEKLGLDNDQSLEELGLNNDNDTDTDQEQEEDLLIRSLEQEEEEEEEEEKEEEVKEDNEDKNTVNIKTSNTEDDKNNIYNQYINTDFINLVKSKITEIEVKESYTVVEKLYLKFSYISYACIYGSYETQYSNLSMAFIFLAGILQGVKTYEDISENQIVLDLEIVVLYFFTIDLFIKIFAERLTPMQFFMGENKGWNIFDLIIVIASLPFVGGSTLGFLRLLRLAVLFKLVKKIPQLRMIVYGLMGGMSSIGYIILLLFLVIYMYGVFGVMSFKYNDPFHFGSLPIAFVTLFRACTLEDWADCFYLHYYGCSDFPGGLYTMKEDATEDTLSMFICNTDIAEAQPILAIGYWISFIVICSLVMLSLFIGTVTTSMSESMETMKQESMEKERIKAKEKEIAKAEKAALELAKKYSLEEDFESEDEYSYEYDDDYSYIDDDDDSTTILTPDPISEIDYMIDNDDYMIDNDDNMIDNDDNMIDNDDNIIDNDDNMIDNDDNMIDNDDNMIDNDKNITDIGTDVDTDNSNTNSNTNSNNNSNTNNTNTNTNTNDNSNDNNDESNKKQSKNKKKKKKKSNKHKDDVPLGNKSIRNSILELPQILKNSVRVHKKKFHNARDRFRDIFKVEGYESKEQKTLRVKQELVAKVLKRAWKNTEKSAKLAATGKKRNTELLLKDLQNAKPKDKLHLKEQLRVFYLDLAEKCRVIVTDSRFTTTMSLVILFAGGLVGATTSKKLMDNPDVAKSFEIIEWIIVAIFTLEIILKIIMEELEPWRFFNESWNVFDFVVVVCSFIPNAGEGLVLLRILRLLRVLKLVKKLKKLELVVKSLLMGLKSIFFIGVIIFGLQYCFAIIGCLLFSANDPWHFGNVHLGMITLFRISTLEDWTDIMYMNMFGCDTWQYDDDQIQANNCQNSKAIGFAAVIYFFIYVVIGSLVLLTLFVGVVTTSMDEVMKKQQEEEELQADVDEFVAQVGMSDKDVREYREVFEAMDFDSGGTVDNDELKTAIKLAKLPFTDKQIDEIMLEIDDDGNDEIDFYEFLQFMDSIKARQAQKMQKISWANRVFTNSYNDATLVKAQNERMKLMLNTDSDNNLENDNDNNNGLAPGFSSTDDLFQEDTEIFKQLNITNRYQHPDLGDIKDRRGKVISPVLKHSRSHSALKSLIIDESLATSPVLSEQLLPPYSPKLPEKKVNYIDQKYTTVKLATKCRKLPNMDLFSKTDAFVVLMIKEDEELLELCRTEVVDDDLDPTFETLLDTKCKYSENIKFTLKVYDEDQKDKMDLKLHDLCGTAEASLQEIVLAGENGLEVVLKKCKNKKASIIITAIYDKIII